jgi:hypothetical protein
MRALELNPKVHERIAEVKAYAEVHRETMADMMRRMNKEGCAPGDNPQHVVNIFDGFKVVYSIEQQAFGWCHHISISVDTRDPEKKLPHPVAAKIILQLFDLKWGEEIQFKNNENDVVPNVEFWFKYDPA